MATLPITSGNINLTDVQDFFNIPRGGRAGDYPTTGGVALEDLGTIVSNGRYSWPSDASTALGQAGFTYTPGTNDASSFTTASGAINNGTGAAIPITDARMDIDFTLSDFADGITTVSPRILCRLGSTAVFDIRATGLTESNYVMSDTTSGDTSWPAGDDLRCYFDESNSAERPFTITINHIRISFTQAEFVPGPGGVGANLADYVRRGPIVPATSGGEATYPTTGGFAIENAGTFEARSTDSTNWAASADGVEVQGMPGIEYSIGGSGSFEGGGRFRNNTGNTITVQGNLRLRFTASNFRGDSTATIQPFFWNEESTFVQGTFTRPADPNGSVSGEIIINPTASQSTQWVQGGFLDFIYFDNQGDRPYDVTIDSLRVRFQGTEEFAPTGGPTEINTGIPETVNGLNLNQFYGVDDGED